MLLPGGRTDFDGFTTRHVDLRYKTELLDFGSLGKVRVRRRC
jgi:hypothetical protein